MPVRFITSLLDMTVVEASDGSMEDVEVVVVVVVAAVVVVVVAAIYGSKSGMSKLIVAKLVKRNNVHTGESG
jgi:uncharacterized Rmd1/YagE family protein